MGWIHNFPLGVPTLVGDASSQPLTQALFGKNKLYVKTKEFGLVGAGPLAGKFSIWICHCET